MPVESEGKWAVQPGAPEDDGFDKMDGTGLPNSESPHRQHATRDVFRDGHFSFGRLDVVERTWIVIPSLPMWPGKKSVKKGDHPMTLKKYDVAIIGAGPAGIFAALELTAKSKARVVVIDKGAPLEKRSCRTQREYGRCLRCEPCAVTCGWGGAGAFSDGKLTLTHAFGGFLNEFIEQPVVEQLIEEVDKIYISYGASGTYNGKRGLILENRITMPAAWQAIVENGKIKYWQVYADWTDGYKIIEEDTKNG